MNGLKIVSYNIKGLGNPIKRKKILNQLKALQCSVAMLQETHLSEVGWNMYTVHLMEEGGKGVLLSYCEEMFSLVVKKY